MTYRTFAAGLALLALTAAAQAGEVTLHRVRYDQLVDVVKQHRGRVVLVDFWASFCQPCKKAFPKLIQMHQKHATEGLVVITVSMDDPEDADAEKAARDFLRSVNAPFLNLLLDEKSEAWKDRLPVTSLPSVYLFNREGQVERRWLEGPDYASIEQLVVQLLRRR